MAVPDPTQQRVVRSFGVSAEAATAMRAAQENDRHADRFVSDAAWIREALAAATAAVAATGPLPELPPRLPKKLPR